MAELKALKSRRTSSRLAGQKRSFNEDETLIPASFFDEKSEDIGTAEKELNQEDKEEIVEVNESTEDLNADARVKKTMMIYQTLYLVYIRKEQERWQREKRAENSRKICKRPDLKVRKMMIDSGQALYPVKMVGSIPGIPVGFQCYSRAEMSVLCVQHESYKGIDIIDKASCGEQYKNYTFPIAISVVMSGVYKDDEDNLDQIWYSGEGGNDKSRDQKMSGGNLALKNSMIQEIHIRVIRGHQVTKDVSSTGKVYTYDGLYKVQRYVADRQSGFTVFKFQLNRVPGQPPLTTKRVGYVGAQASPSDLKSSGMVCVDISGGDEEIKVAAFNLVDNPPVGPTGFIYCKSVRNPENITIPTINTGCSCKGACTDVNKCACAKLNGSKFPYVKAKGGRLVKPKGFVVECGPHCKCGSKCVNRTSQQGLRFNLEVFRTPNKGWAVRSRNFICSGAPVCEYTGTLMRTKDIDSVSENDYIFEIDCLETMKGLDGRQSRPGGVSIPGCSLTEELNNGKTECEPEFCIDASAYGGVARFINHSCAPNLFVQCVLSSHHDLRLARIMLFASNDIPPLQELCYDYNYQVGTVTDQDGKMKEMPCYCGAEKCRKRLY